MKHATPSPLARLIAGDQAVVCIDPDGRMHHHIPAPLVVVPGSFNPLHHGHRELGRAAAQLTSRALAFELSMVHVDKPELSAEEVRRRASQFEWFASLLVTRAPLFEQKAQLFPGAAFVLGMDTANRLLDPRYYDGDAGRMARCLEQIRALGCRVFVAGRHDEAGVFQELSALPVPSDYADLFLPISQQLFSVRISSTELRQ